MDGILVVYKPSGITSRDVVNQVGKILHTKKIGHTGTLDPLASGVLVLCVGKATKIVELLTATEKEYQAEMIFGIETDTLDITGTILKEQKIKLKEEDVKTVLKKMERTYNQEVPAYSAVRVNGKKLYEYARKKEEIKLPSRPVTIFSLNLLNFAFPKITFQTKVSKGTYIRSLTRDIAYQLNTIAVMSKLKRTKQGIFTLEDAFTLEEIENGNFSFVPIQKVLEKYKTIIADSKLQEKIKNGQLLKKQEEESVILFVDKNSNPLALYHSYPKNKDYLKPWKMF